MYSSHATLVEGQRSTWTSVVSPRADVSNAYAYDSLLRLVIQMMQHILPDALLNRRKEDMIVPYDRLERFRANQKNSGQGCSRSLSVQQWVRFSPFCFMAQRYGMTLLTRRYIVTCASGETFRVSFAHRNILSQNQPWCWSQEWPPSPFVSRFTGWRFSSRLSPLRASNPNMHSVHQALQYQFA